MTSQCLSLLFSSLFFIQFSFSQETKFTPLMDEPITGHVISQTETTENGCLIFQRSGSGFGLHIYTHYFENNKIISTKIGNLSAKRLATPVQLNDYAAIELNGKHFSIELSKSKKELMLKGRDEKTLAYTGDDKVLLNKTELFTYNTIYITENYFLIGFFPKKYSLSQKPSFWKVQVFNKSTLEKVNSVTLKAPDIFHTSKCLDFDINEKGELITISAPIQDLGSAGTGLGMRLDYTVYGESPKTYYYNLQGRIMDNASIRNKNNQVFIEVYESNTNGVSKKTFEFKDDKLNVVNNIEMSFGKLFENSSNNLPEQLLNNKKKLDNFIKYINVGQKQLKSSDGTIYIDEFNVVFYNGPLLMPESNSVTFIYKIGLNGQIQWLNTYPIVCSSIFRAKIDSNNELHLFLSEQSIYYKVDGSFNEIVSQKLGDKSKFVTSHILIDSTGEIKKREILTEGLSEDEMLIGIEIHDEPLDQVLMGRIKNQRGKNEMTIGIVNLN